MSNEKFYSKSVIFKENTAFLFCRGCKSIILRTSGDRYKYLLFNFSCRCGTTGFFEKIVGRKPEIQNSRRKLYKDKLSYCCPSDDNLNFSPSIITLKSFGIRVLCDCGTEFEMGRSFVFDDNIPK